MKAAMSAGLNLAIKIRCETLAKTTLVSLLQLPFVLIVRSDCA